MCNLKYVHCETIVDSIDAVAFVVVLQSGFVVLPMTLPSIRMMCFQGGPRAAQGPQRVCRRRSQARERARQPPKPLNKLPSWTATVNFVLYNLLIHVCEENVDLGWVLAAVWASESLKWDFKKISETDNPNLPGSTSGTSHLAIQQKKLWLGNKLWRLYLIAS